MTNMRYVLQIKNYVEIFQHKYSKNIWTKIFLKESWPCQKHCSCNCSNCGEGSWWFQRCWENQVWFLDRFYFDLLVFSEKWLFWSKKLTIQVLFDNHFCSFVFFFIHSWLIPLVKTGWWQGWLDSCCWSLAPPYVQGFAGN